MTPSKFPSFILSFCLHVGVALLIFFMPTPSSLPDPMSGVTITGIVTLGKAGGAARPVPKKAEAESAGQEKPKAVEKPKAEESKTVAQIEKPVKEEPVK